jgi:hypothetical protein
LQISMSGRGANIAIVGTRRPVEDCSGVNPKEPNTPPRSRPKGDARSLPPGSGFIIVTMAMIVIYLGVAAAIGAI